MSRNDSSSQIISLVNKASVAHPDQNDMKEEAMLGVDDISRGPELGLGPQLEEEININSKTPRENGSVLLLAANP